MKKILEYTLAKLAKEILKKYRPKIIGITGSIGKTSTKEAIYAVLSAKHSVRKNIKNYNNELGLPLSIIGMEAQGKSILGWIRVFARAFLLILKNNENFPKIFVLEMGADKPGDIGHLVKIAPCNIGVLTKIGPTHLQFFGTIENIVKEKQKIITHLNKDNFAILNFDDPLIKKLGQKTKAKIISYGYAEEAGVRAIELSELHSGIKLAGIKFKINYRGSSVPVFLPGVVGAHQINSALAAAAVGLAFDMNLIEISEGLKNYRTPRGRMNLIEGEKDSLVIDDTYNSSPDAAAAALVTLRDLKIPEAKRRVAILGDMLELGDYSTEAHFILGKRAAEAGVGLLVAVGKYRTKIVEGARSAGLETISQFRNSKDASEAINNLLQENDLVLVKGSQGARMERVVKAMMKEKDKAEGLLVRQSDDWLRK